MCEVTLHLFLIPAAGTPWSLFLSDPFSDCETHSGPVQGGRTRDKQLGGQLSRSCPCHLPPPESSEAESFLCLGTCHVSSFLQH